MIDTKKEKKEKKGDLDFHFFIILILFFPIGIRFFFFFCDWRCGKYKGADETNENNFFIIFLFLSTPL